MLKLKTKWFHKWAKKNLISDKALLKTIESLINNLTVADLGGGLYKVPTPAIGKGKSGGFRTLVACKEMDKAIFVFGFSKAEKDNLDEDELRSFKNLAKDLLQISTKEYLRLIESGHFFKLE